MKFFVMLTLIASTQAFAGHGKGMSMMEDMSKRPFAENQKMMQEKLDKREASITTARSCVKKATTNEALRECHRQMREDRQAMMDEMHDEMESSSQKMEDKTDSMDKKVDE